MKEKLTVLLAAYNGRKFIQQQISSILSSRCDIGVSIVVSVDPSSDGTAEILKRIEDGAVRVLWNDSSSGGAKQNFSRLVDYSLALDSRYYAFSDQDDVWDNDKIDKTLGKLKEMEQKYGANLPLLVFSDSRLVSENMTLLEPSFMQAEALNPGAVNDVYRLLVQNVGQGCTFIFNRALLDAATPISEDARMHDHWFMLVACAFGKIGYVSEQLVSYRQHSSNVLGGGRLGLGGAILRALKKSRGIKDAIALSQRQARAFRIRYQDLLNSDVCSFIIEFEALSTRGWLYRKWFCIRYRLRMGDPLRTLGLYIFI